MQDSRYKLEVHRPQSSFERVVAWQKARELNRDVYKSFASLSDWGFRDQVLRCSISIMNNIAEGLESGSQVQLKRYLVIAKASSGELRSMFFAAYDIGYFDEITFVSFNERAKEVSRILDGFIRSLR